MTPLLLLSTTFIISAFIFYTIGIWSEKISRKMKLWHVILMWLGFLCDSTGTALR